MLISGVISAQDPFITTWNTQNTGTSNTDQITIPSIGSNMTIYWEDTSNPLINGNVPSFNGNVTVTFPNPGIYRVEISGGLTSFNFYNNGDKLKLISLNQWGDIAWTTFQSAFYGCENMVYNATDAPDLSNVTILNAAFYGCLLFDGDLSNWDVSNVQRMVQTFQQCEAFNGNISNWDVSSVTSLQYTFVNCYNFNQPLNNWDVSNVTDMIRTFYGCQSFNQDLNNWNTSNVTDFGDIFQNCYVFNGDITTWDVTGATSLGFLFRNCYVFNQDISSWDLSNCTFLSSMFIGCSSFNQDISNWDVSNVTSFYSMFSYATAFNQDISTWNTGAATNMARMFRNATDFNQDLGDWNVANVTDFSRMFESTGLSVCNYDALLNGWSVQSLQPSMLFEGGFSRYSNLSIASRQAIIDNFGWTITDGGLLQVTVTATDPLCFGLNDGSLLINTNGYDLFDPFIIDYVGANNTGSSNMAATVIDIQNLIADPSIMVSVTDEDGCQFFSESLALQNPPELVIDTVAFNLISCFGLADGEIEVVVQGGTGTLNSVWTDDNGVIGNSTNVSNLSPGNYDYQVTDLNGCVSSLNFSLTQPDELTVNGIINGDQITTNPSGGTGAYTVAWTGPNGYTESSSNITVSENGVYSITIIDENNCEANESFTVNSVGINNYLDSESNTLVFPNPTSGILNIQLIEGSSVVGLFDILGNQIEEFVLITSSQIDISSYPDGVYFLTIQDINAQLISTIKVTKH